MKTWILAVLATVSLSLVAGAVFATPPKILNAGPVHEAGYTGETRGAFFATCSTAGDGGVLSRKIPVDGGTVYPTINGRYVLTVGTKSAIRLQNGGPCNSFSGSDQSGRAVNEGSTIDWTALPAPDGGIPIYSCCAEGSGAWYELAPLE